MSKELTAVSLFAGVGGFDLALEGNGVKVAAAVEIDDAARGVLKHRFPNTTLFTDVCKVTGKELIDAGFVPERGILVGGFPCQDLSIAGKRAGLAGQRSGLFWEICRLIDETRPKWFVLENVPGLLSSNGGRDMGVVIGALVERGYGISWRVLDAQHFGVPQRRRRVFIVGRLGDDGRAPFEVLAVSEGRVGNPASRKSKGQEASGTAGERAASDSGDGDRVDVEVARKLTHDSYTMDETTSTIAARDYKSSTDLVIKDSEAVLMRQREGKPGGGKGPLLSVEKSLTIATSNDQALFTPIINTFYAIDDEQNGRENLMGTLKARASSGGQQMAVVYEPKSAFEENWAQSDVKNALRAEASKSSHAVVHARDERDKDLVHDFE